MDETRNDASSAKHDASTPGGIRRRDFIGALGAAATAGAFLGKAERLAGQSAVYWYYDSFGNVVPASPDTIGVGVYPPPLPAGVTPGAPASLPAMCPRTYVTDGYNQTNILLIMVDQMRLPRWLTAAQRTIFNQEIMPNVFNAGVSTSSVSNSYQFRNYFVAAARCTSSRATLLTGLYPQQTCVFVTQAQGMYIAPSLEPYDGGNGFATIGDVLSSTFPINCRGQGGTSVACDTAWISLCCRNRMLPRTKRVHPHNQENIVDAKKRNVAFT